MSLPNAVARVKDEADPKPHQNGQLGEPHHISEATGTCHVTSCRLSHAWAVLLLPVGEEELVTGDGESPPRLGVRRVVRGECGGHAGLHGLVVKLGLLVHPARTPPVVPCYTRGVRWWSYYHATLATSATYLLLLLPLSTSHIDPHELWKYNRRL